MLRTVLFFFLLLSGSAWANYADTYASDAARKAIVTDFEEKKTDKYKLDNLPFFTQKQLVERGVFTSDQKLVRDAEGEVFTFDSILALQTCEQIQPGYTATIYDVRPDVGEIVCSFSRPGKLYSPIGLFRVVYPKIKEYYSLDKKASEIENVDYIARANEQFQPVYEARREIEESVLSTGDQYLTITQLITAGILTDTDIIDVEATAAADKLQLRNGYTSKFMAQNENGNTVVDDNADYIMTDVETIFDVYTGLSDLSMSMLLVLIVFFGVYGIGRSILAPLADKAEGLQNHDKKIPFVAGLIAGVVMFFPYSDHETIVDGNDETVGQYQIMKTKYQDWEKTGYYLFSEWADGAAKVIIDAELNAIIDKSGIGTQDQIVNTYAHKVQAERLLNAYRAEYATCTSTYDLDEMVYPNKQPVYSLAPSYKFPFSEHWAYATKIGTHTAKSYYMASPRGLVLPEGYAGQSSVTIDERVFPLYPKIAMSACGKAEQRIQLYEERLGDYIKQYDLLVGGDELAEAKINMINGLVRFQYELYRDWGFLAVLGLPVTKMQSEHIGGLYNADSEVLERLNNEIKKDSFLGGTHMLMSSLPYLFVPGAGTVYKAIDDNSGKFATLAGAGVGAIGGGGVLSWFTSLAGGAIAGVAGTVASSAIALAGAYQVAKAILALTPIIGIVVIGIVRFIVIIIKIFSFHFVSLFLMPIMFARENIKAITDFTMKVFATMLELPLFVLSIWLAVTANSLIHNIGDFFGKRIIIGMLDNNEAQYVAKSGIQEWLGKLKIYLFDGFVELTITVFSIVIIYKLIISMHTMVLDAISLRGSEQLDNAVESMKNESAGWGARV